MRKKIALTLLILANILLLAHSAIPHRHEGENNCSSCYECATLSDTEHYYDSHSDSDGHQSAECSIQDIFTRPSNEHKHTDCVCCTDPSLPLTTPAGEDIPGTYDVCHNYQYSPYRQPRCCVVISRGLGLRGPPAC